MHRLLSALSLALLSASVPAQWIYPTLTPAPGTAEIVFNGELDPGEWEGLSTTTADPMSGASPEVTVSCHLDSETLWLRLTWRDSTPDLSLAPWKRRAGEWVRTDAQDDQVEIWWSDIAQPPGTFHDIWRWGARLTNPIGHALDLHVRSSLSQPSILPVPDPGVGAVRENDQHSLPIQTWSRQSQPIPWMADLGALPPLFADRLDWTEGRNPLTGSGWAEGDGIPRIVHVIPGESAGDVGARARWVEGQWTLEFRRARDTGDASHDLPFPDRRRALLEIRLRDGATGEMTAHRVLMLLD